MEILKIKDWLQKKPQFSMRKCLYGTIVEADRLVDSAEFSLGPIPGTNIFIWEFTSDFIHVLYNHNGVNADNLITCEINELPSPNYTLLTDEQNEITLKMVSTPIKGKPKKLRVKW